MQRQIFVCDNPKYPNCKIVKEVVERYEAPATGIQVSIMSPDTRKFFARQLVIDGNPQPKENKLSCPVFAVSSLAQREDFVRRDTMRFLGVLD